MPATRQLSCPRCPGEVLDAIAHDRHEVDLCPSCRGTWLDAEEWSAVIDRTATVDNARAADDAAVTAPPPCPACSATGSGPASAPLLKPCRLVGGGDVVIDACPACDGAWLDGGEIPKLKQELAASRARVSATPQVGAGTSPPPLPGQPARSPGVTSPDADRYLTMGAAVAQTLLGALVAIASQPPRRRGRFGRRRHGSSSLIGVLLRAFLRR